LSSYFIGLLCLLELAGVMPRFSGALMSMQFLVIHSSVFILAVPLTNADETLKRRIFLGLLALYTILAYSMAGIFGVAEFAGLTYSTYIGYIFTREEECAKIELGLRWIAAFAAFMLAIGLCGAPESVESWGGDRRLALAGGVYFGVLGLLEQSGFYGSGWKKVLRKLAEKDPQFRERMPAWLYLALYRKKQEPPTPPGTGMPG
jgi:hypothetical protein